MSSPAARNNSKRNVTVALLFSLFCLGVFLRTNLAANADKGGAGEILEQQQQQDSAPAVARMKSGHRAGPNSEVGGDQPHVVEVPAQISSGTSSGVAVAAPSADKKGKGPQQKSTLNENEKEDATSTSSTVTTIQNQKKKINPRAIRAAVVVLLASNLKSNKVDVNTLNGFGVLKQSMLDAIGKGGDFGYQEKVRQPPSRTSAAEKAEGGSGGGGGGSGGEDSLEKELSSLAEGRDKRQKQRHAPVGEYGVTRPYRHSTAPQTGVTSYIFPSKTEPGKTIHLEFLVVATPDLELSEKTIAFLEQRLHYHVRSAVTPIEPEEVRRKNIAEEVKKDGAMGINEMIKLEALRFRGFEKVIMLDADIQFHQRFDELFDNEDISLSGWTHGGWNIERMNGGFLVFSPKADTGLFERLCVKGKARLEKEREWQTQAWTEFDRNAENLVARCPLQAETESDMHFFTMVDLLRQGDFRSGSGWKGGGIGWTYGGRTIQGLLPYYYFIGVELLQSVSKVLAPSPASSSAENDAGKNNNEKLDADDIRNAFGIFRALQHKAKQLSQQDIEKADTSAHTAPEGSRFHKEIDRCRYNNMAQLEKCKAGSYPIQKQPGLSTSNHFTGACPKPWFCSHGAGDPNCVHFSRKWFEHYHNLVRAVKEEEFKGQKVSDNYGNDYKGCHFGRFKSLAEKYV